RRGARESEGLSRHGSVHGRAARRRRRARELEELGARQHRGVQGAARCRGEGVPRERVHLRCAEGHDVSLAAAAGGNRERGVCRPAHGGAGRDRAARLGTRRGRRRILPRLVHHVAGTDRGGGGAGGEGAGGARAARASSYGRAWILCRLSVKNFFCIACAPSSKKSIRSSTRSASSSARRAQSLSLSEMQASVSTVQPSTSSGYSSVSRLAAASPSACSPCRRCADATVRSHLADGATVYPTRAMSDL